MKVAEIIIIATVAALLTTGGVLAVVLTPLPSPCPGQIVVTRTFTIVVNLNGYNDSGSHAGSWPIISAQRCDQVVITVINQDTQPHGFAVQSYSNAGLEITGGDHQTLRFQATRAGHFIMYCTIRCSVHPLMQNGLLNIS